MSQVIFVYYYLYVFIELYFQGKNVRNKCYDILDLYSCYLFQDNIYKKEFFCFIFYRMYYFLLVSKFVMYRFVCYFQFGGIKLFIREDFMGLLILNVCLKYVKIYYLRYFFLLGLSIFCI